MYTLYDGVFSFFLILSAFSEDGLYFFKREEWSLGRASALPHPARGVPADSRRSVLRAHNKNIFKMATIAT